MRDPELEAYVAAVERHFGRRRGREYVLSPPEFDLARDWFTAGLAVPTVLTGIDAAFAGETQPTSLTFCRRFVEALTNPAKRS
jgi:hypothetical protein